MLDPDSIPAHPALRSLIRRSTRPSRDRPDALAFDERDIGQELLLGLIRSVRDFDAERGSAAAFGFAVLRRAASGLRRRRGRRERHGRFFTLEEMDKSEPPVPRWLNTEAICDLRIDLMKAIAALPDDLLPLALLLLTGTVADVAREAGWPRSTLVRRIERLKKHLEKAGLDIYL